MTEFEVTGLWRNFMPRRGEILNVVSDELISVSIYDPSYFNEFDPERQFEKWAAVEVSEFEEIPANMSSLILPAGLYAVFRYKGPSSDPSIFQFIYGTWLPGSGYTLDHRPHFEILGENYSKGEAYSEEEIWVPVYKDRP
jgi:AraC family transcriptional regulator